MAIERALGERAGEINALIENRLSPTAVGAVVQAFATDWPDAGAAWRWLHERLLPAEYAAMHRLFHKQMTNSDRAAVLRHLAG